MGIELLAAGKRKKRSSHGLSDWSTGPKTPTAQVMRKWGQLCARQQRKGRRLPVLDSLIAATALAHDLGLVTRNTNDYPDEVRLFNPWNQ